MLALREPLDQAVRQQAQRQPVEQTLQHLLAQGLVHLVGHFADRDGQDQWSGGLHPYQQVVSLSGLQVECHRWRAAG
ncbi:hypothetical protein D3C71_1464120 [compost metagenome]